MADNSRPTSAKLRSQKKLKFLKPKGDWMPVRKVRSRLASPAPDKNASNSRSPIHFNIRLRSPKSSPDSRRAFSENASPNVSGQSNAKGSLENGIQQPTMKKAHHRNNSTSKLDKFMIEDGSQSQREDDRERLIQKIVLNFRTKRVPPPTTVNFYKYGKLIGRGAFGKVYLGIHKLTGLKVAIKAIDKANIRDERKRRKVLQEVCVMKRIKHRNVVKLFEVFESSRHLLMVMEYAGGGDLLQLIKSRKKITESEARVVFGQVVDGIRACHRKNVIHRDIKLDNILLNSDLSCAKICDFGVSRIAKFGEKVHEQCGTPAYLAPEIIAGRGYEPFYVDIWSLGVLLYAMVSGTVPFKAKTLSELHKLILKGNYEFPEELSSELADLVKLMLNPIPHFRIQLNDIYNHPWLRKLMPGGPGDSVYPKISSESFTEHKNSTRTIMVKMLELGFPEDYVLECIKYGDLNHASATYQLLEVSNC